jgi:uncharacterized membrane protein
MRQKPLLILNSLLIVAMLGLSAWAWQHIPNTQEIPVHYDIQGTPDRWGNKWEGLLALPLVAAGLTALFAVVPWIEPRAQNLARSQTAYSATAIAAMVLLVSIHGATVLQAVGWQIPVATVVAVGVSLLLAILGNYLGKIRSNFSFGIRTPWTLSSEQAWNKTHRLGGRLLFGLGMSGAIAALANANQLFVLLMLGGTTGTSLFLIVYSYQVWKQDPDRHSQ